MYNYVLQEYLDLDHMESADPCEITSNGKVFSFYLPHHAVVKPDKVTTKVRVKSNKTIWNHGILRRMIKAYSEIKIPKNGEKTTTKYKSMLYIPGFSDRLKGSDIYDKENIKIAHKPAYTTNIFYNNMKSKVALLDKNNIVYKITCAGNENDKCNKEYVGTTKNKLKTRISGHRSDIKCRAATNMQKTALAAHCAESGHQPDFEAVSILQTEQNYKKRFTLEIIVYYIEMLHITNTPINKRLNYKIDT
ncbi:uncharacterized protein, partial [Eurosta solidaginis]|uniref:uncharacterized protein n=1 Tax=Eurosta solidaginis TaxID=178769 RepID=UPI003530AA38